MISKVVEERVVMVKVGSVVEHESGRTELLLPCEWEAAPFRWPNPIYEWRESHAIAINVEITGRTFQRRQGDYYVRIRMEWVGDGEPSTFCAGWLKVNPYDCPYARDVA